MFFIHMMDGCSVIKKESIEDLSKRIYLAFSKKIKIHIKLKDESWRNGYVKNISPDFFIFDDRVHGIEGIFYLELKRVKPFTEANLKEELEKDGDGTNKSEF